MEFEIKIQTKIQKPLEEVFNAVYLPEKLSGYFVGHSSGPLEEGKTVDWTWADFPELGLCPVKVTKVIPNELIRFEWKASDGDYQTKVEMFFTKLEANNTMIQISESGWKNTPEAQKASYSNCEGWTQMSACLKAYLEYGINLRKGYYR